MKIAEILRQLADHIDSINELGTEESGTDTAADQLQQNPVMVSPQQQERTRQL